MIPIHQQLLVLTNSFATVACIECVGHDNWSLFLCIYQRHLEVFCHCRSASSENSLRVGQETVNVPSPLRTHPWARSLPKCWSWTKERLQSRPMSPAPIMQAEKKLFFLEPASNNQRSPWLRSRVRGNTSSRSIPLNPYIHEIQQ
jgi:hypothetical protein